MDEQEPNDRELVRGWMTANPVAVRPDATAFDALSRMWQYGIRHLPVTLAGRLVGIVSNRDLHLAVPMHEVADKSFVDILAATEVESIMTRAPATVTQDTLLIHAVRIMYDRKISSLPVVDHGFLTGVLTTQDLLRALGDRLWFGDAGPPSEE